MSCNSDRLKAILIIVMSLAFVSTKKIFYGKCCDALVCTSRTLQIVGCSCLKNTTTNMYSENSHIELSSNHPFLVHQLSVFVHAMLYQKVLLCFYFRSKSYRRKVGQICSRDVLGVIKLLHKILAVSVLLAYDCQVSSNYALYEDVIYLIILQRHQLVPFAAIMFMSVSLISMVKMISYLWKQFCV